MTDGISPEQVVDEAIARIKEILSDPDAHLAALAIEHGLVLCSSDSDFARFPGLRWDNPLIEPARRG